MTRARFYLTLAALCGMCVVWSIFTALPTEARIQQAERGGK